MFEHVFEARRVQVVFVTRSGLCWCSLPWFWGRTHPKQSVKKQTWCQMKPGETFLWFCILVVNGICAKAEVSLSFLSPTAAHSKCSLCLAGGCTLPPSAPLPATSALHLSCMKENFVFPSSKNPTLLSIHLPLNVNVLCTKWLQTGNYSSESGK